MKHLHGPDVASGPWVGYPWFIPCIQELGRIDILPLDINIVDFILFMIAAA